VKELIRTLPPCSIKNLNISITIKNDKMSGGEKVDRRTTLKIVSGTVAGLVIGGVAGWFARPAEVTAEIVTRTVTETVTERAGTVTTTQTVTAPATLPEPEEKLIRWWKEAGRRYSGITIKILAQAWEPNFYLRDVVAPKFTELTGIKVDWELTSNELVLEKEILDMERCTAIYTSTYDDQDMVGTWIRKGWTIPYNELMEDHPELVEPAFNPDDIFPLPYCMDAKGRILSIPAEYFPKTYIYRTDLFENPKEKEEFKKKYGYELRPPRYYDEMLDIAEFFTRPPDLYGFIGADGAKAHEALGFDFFETWFPSCGATGEGLDPYPRDILPWGINTKTWSASVANGGMLDSPQAIRAIETFLKWLPYAPPGVREMIYAEAGEQVAAGRVAQAMTYTQFVSTYANPQLSKIAGKFRLALPPVDREYWRPYMPIGYADISGYTVPKCSPHPEAALLWAQFVISPLNELERAKAIGTTVRTSVLINPELNPLDKKFGGLFSLIRDQIARRYFVGTPLEIGDYAPLLYVYYTTLAKAVSGELTPEQCAKELARAIDDELKKLGYR
jgi:multiple sugar transport system substrate-binding protein